MNFLSSFYRKSYCRLGPTAKVMFWLAITGLVVAIGFGLLSWWQGKHLATKEGQDIALKDADLKHEDEMAFLRNIEKQNKEIQQRLNALANGDRDKLQSDFPGGYKLFATYGGFVVPGPAAKDFIVSIDWDRVHVKILRNDWLAVVFPSFKVSGATNMNIQDFHLTFCKEVGAEQSIFASGDQHLFLKVIDIDGNAVTLAFGVGPIANYHPKWGPCQSN